MKYLLMKSAVAAAVALTASAVYAQSPSIDYARVSIQLASQMTSGAGDITISNLNGSALQNGTLTVTGTAGVLDLTTSAGEVLTSGGMLLGIAGQSVRVKDLEVDATTPSIPQITGLFVYQNHVEGRLPIFDLPSVPQSGLPLVPTAGVVQLNNVPIRISAAFASAVNKVLNSNVLQAEAPVGSTSIYLVLSPTN